MTTPLPTRVGHLVKLMPSSDQVGEVAGAAMALNRVITAQGMDIHQFTDIVMAALEKERPVEKADGQEWLDVDQMTLHYHQKPGGRPTLRLLYRCGASSFFDWLASEHGGVAREIAIEKWCALGGRLPAPRTVDEALHRENELCADVEIAVCRNGRYWSVTGQRVRQGVAA